MGKHGDIEAGTAGGELYPSMAENPQLRWAFIRKVYSIVALQFFLTGVVAATVNFVRPIPDFLLSGTPASWVVMILLLVAPFFVMLAMMYYQERHPLNMFLLGLFTICISFTVGLSCATRSGKVILEAALLTTLVVVALTLYTFWAAKKGYDFNFLGPFLVAAMLVLMIYVLVQMFLPLGSLRNTIYGCLAALIFSGFIIYDTDNLIKRYSYDQYVSAAISLYLDMINLFMALLTVFSSSE